MLQAMSFDRCIPWVGDPVAHQQTLSVRLQLFRFNEIFVHR
ncbi:hypothetical protein C4K09_2042 [Pseudomonas chlororaphis subsp. aureofaciens]|nr:hypothetical protein C4K09_2042 [Pseudomonas chlororaphis subsp. aureofaciens]